MSFEWQTVEDIESVMARSYMGVMDSFEVTRHLKKSLTTGTSGAFQSTFGPYTFVQAAAKSPIFGSLPKYGWNMTGFRAWTSVPGTQGGTAEGGSLASATDLSYTQITPNRKLQQVVYQVSDTRVELEGKDDVGPTLEEYRRSQSVNHMRGIEQSVSIDLATAASNNFESLDRAIASTAEVTGGHGSAGNEDIHGVDRSANAWFDAVVSHGSTVDRDFVPNLVTEVLNDVRKADSEPTGILTGYDIMEAWANIYESAQQFQGFGESSVELGLNGVRTLRGVQGGTPVASFHGIPIIPSERIETNLKDTVSRVYILDTTVEPDTGRPRIGFSVIKPTQHVESTNIIVNGAFVVKGVYYTQGELAVTVPSKQGKVIDLK